MAMRIPGLHQRASLWYASQELWTDAVQHAIAGSDAVRALEWIKNCAMPLVKRGDLFTLLGWQRLFPTALMRSQPEVALAIAWPRLSTKPGQAQKANAREFAANVRPIQHLACAGLHGC